MYVDFDTLKDSSRVWVYQSNREFNDQEMEVISEKLKDFVNEFIIIIGYKGEQIKSALGDHFEDIPITYIEQKQQLGTGHALLCAKDYLKGRFIVLPGDDLFMKSDIQKCLNHKFCVLKFFQADSFLMPKVRCRKLKHQTRRVPLLKNWSCVKL